MRILHTIAARDWGGIAYRTIEQVAWLNSHGHQSWLASPGGSAVALRAKTAGIPVVEFNFDRPFAPSTAWALRRLVGDLRCDVIEAHTGRCANATLMVRDRCTIIRTRHTTRQLKPTFSRWLRWRWGWDWTVATAQTIADDLLAAELVPPNRISVIGEWAENRFFERTLWPEWRRTWRDRLGIPNGTFVVGAVGMLRPEKGFDTLIRAMKIVTDTHPDAIAVIVGEATEAGSPYERDLRSLVGSLGITDNVIFTGYSDDIPGLMQVFDVVAVPSTFEAQSRVIPEALASQRPIVASRVGGITELITHGKSGWLVWPKDPAALAFHLIDIGNSPAMTAAICDRGGAFARETLQIDAKMQQYLQAYARVPRGRMSATPPAG
ncbi:glycosyltransferase family 4 protein [Telmatospirillum sp.]|uniref:glycosyltransferase family 4 protein n=1 Tax=Telmatospirillum sp. TaxID=2079197 RepID=UPI00284DBAB2|nr:glycosyltransferase family 4 protein [Telmatospirillum sp.]MDR3436540.1 glycosyltransferase family 4 protein [Telmatospirillum sp.]